jgi:hypothetical protein
MCKFHLEKEAGMLCPQVSSGKGIKGHSEGEDGDPQWSEDKGYEGIMVAWITKKRWHRAVGRKRRQALLEVDFTFFLGVKITGNMCW